jgi:hypothetical protein
MKKIFTLIAAVVMGVGVASAQGLSAEAVAGLNVSDWGGLGDRAGFHVGIRGEYMTPVKGLYANAAALFSLKGCKQDYGEWGAARSDAYYVEFPIHVGYKFAVNDSFAVFGDAGPYLGVGLFGSTHAIGDDNKEYFESEIVFDEAKRFDFGVGLRVGVEFFKRYSFSVGYDWGLLDSNTDAVDSDDYIYDDIYVDLTPSMKHTNLMVSFGVKF